jgi:hypothetical protein
MPSVLLLTEPSGFTLLHICPRLFGGIEFAAFKLLKSELDLVSDFLPLLMKPAVFIP